MSVHMEEGGRKEVVLHLILDVQRTRLPVEELQGLHVAVSGCVVDSVGSALRLEEEEEEEKLQDLFLTCHGESP